jgi:broad specificity phosphatase PhoE
VRPRRGFDRSEIAFSFWSKIDDATWTAGVRLSYMRVSSVEFCIVQHAENVRGEGDPGLTQRGCEQAELTAEHLASERFEGLWASPLRRALETTELIGRGIQLRPVVDDRIRERMNWGDGPEGQTLEEFLAEWKRATLDRDFVPCSGDSSRQAGERFSALLDEITERGGVNRVALVTHGGITVDLLRNSLATTTSVERHVV